MEEEKLELFDRITLLIDEAKALCRVIGKAEEAPGEEAMAGVAEVIDQALLAIKRYHEIASG